VGKGSPPLGCGQLIFSLETQFNPIEVKKCSERVSRHFQRFRAANGDEIRDFSIFEFDL
jgi:hypothetical protein